MLQRYNFFLNWQNILSPLLKKMLKFLSKNEKKASSQVNTNYLISTYQRLTNSYQTPTMVGDDRGVVGE